MFSQIPKERLITYIVVLGLIPFALVLFNFSNKKSALNELSTTLTYTQEKALSYERRQSNNIAVRNAFQNNDHFYIDKQLETLVFLKPEIENLKKITGHKNFTNDKVLEKRLEFLTSPQNRLSFTEGVVITYPLFQETAETLTHPVEVNVNDIKKILSRIEEVKIDEEEPGPNPPQLIVLEFKLDKKKTPEKDDVFSLNMKLLKREFL